MSTQDEETFEQTAQRWMQSDPMYSEPGAQPHPPVQVPTTAEHASWFGGDVSIMSGGLGLFGVASCLVLTVQEWWVPFFVGLAACVVAIYGITRHRANRRGWVAAGLILGAVSLAFGAAAKSSWDDQKCAVEADTFDEMMACDG